MRARVMWSSIVELVGFASSVVGLITAGYGFFSYIAKRGVRVEVPVDSSPQVQQKLAAIAKAQEQLTFPSLALLVIGACSCCFGGLGALAGVLGANLDSAEHGQVKNEAEAKPPLSPEEKKAKQLLTTIVCSLSVFCGVATILGSVAMRNLRFYPVAFVGILGRSATRCVVVPGHRLAYGVWSL
jgi:hypothetical protein